MITHSYIAFTMRRTTSVHRHIKTTRIVNLLQPKKKNQYSHAKSQSNNSAKPENKSKKLTGRPKREAIAFVSVFLQDSQKPARSFWCFKYIRVQAAHRIGRTFCPWEEREEDPWAPGYSCLYVCVCVCIRQCRRGTHTLYTDTIPRCTVTWLGDIRAPSIRCIFLFSFNHIVFILRLKRQVHIFNWKYLALEC